MEERIRQALRAISKEENGARALDILNMSTYFMPARNIHMDMFSCLCDTEELKAVIRLLKQHSLIESEERSTTYIVKEKVQKTLRKFMKERGKERTVLVKTITLLQTLLKDVTHPSVLDHALSVLAFASEYEDLVEISIALPSIIIMKLMKLNKLVEAYSYGRKAMNFLKNNVGEKHAATLTLQHNLATILSAQGKHAETIKTLQLLYENDKEVSGSEEKTHTLVTEARQLCELSKYDEALHIYQILIAEGRVSDTLDDTILTAWHDYALLLHDMGRLSEAFDILQDVLAQHMKVFSVEDNETLQVRCSMACVLMAQENYNRALLHYRDVLETRQRLLGELHPDTLRTRRDIGVVYQYKANYIEALKVLQDVAEKFTQVAGASHPDVLSTRANIAAILMHQNKYDEALEISNEVYCKYKETLGENHNETLRVKSNIGGIYLRQIRITEAIETFQEVFDGFSEVFGPNHDLTKEAKATLDVLRIPQTTEKSIHSAAKNGDLHRISNLIQNGADINEEDYTGRKPIHYAALHGHVRVVKHLLKERAMYNMKDFEGKTPLQLADNSEIRKMLILAQYLFKNVKEGNFEVVAQCISENTYIVNIKDKNGYSLLHWATFKQYLEIVRELLSVADARCTSNKGNTPLHIAASTGHTEIAEILIHSINENELQEFINAKTTSGGNTALHVAAKNNDLEMVRCLIKYGASCDVKNANNETPINLANNPTIRDLLSI
ncbi:ankyrin-1 [Trichonephila clavata]|uniref:Ankyrin-1 n=1 Tax=Trichonephila clavata TaxID=2740835 RepID=A0A8X6FMH0_TRICU|nr:ankyrin-1 [Trichonephila clavata]